MKKTIVIAMLAAGSALSMTHAFAAAGTVNFNGNILDSACDVDVASQNFQRLVREPPRRNSILF